ncbi:class I SAM-dependent methyltransferase [Sulfurospirillum sp. 1612]|uniref:class I SAM-dependent methyltransferase n=1 Tax=Sulfurospirillum sp. 1612 TaxID=3094835 RepID=UPI002F92FEAE
MRCKICHHDTTLINDVKQNKKYHQCHACQTIWMDQECFLDDSKEKQQYNQHHNNFESTGYVKMFENFLDYFWSDLPKDATQALDFGSGPGPVLAEILKRRGLQADGYDKFFQPEKVYEDKQYDLITCTEVLEHVADPKALLMLFKKHLKNRGIIAIMTLFHTNDSREFLDWWYHRDPTHITFYTPHSFEVLADMCGLNIIKHDDKRVIILTSSTS